MSRFLPVVVAAVIGAFPAAATAQVPRQDSVSLTGVASGANFTVTTLNATSGPSGENPSGRVEFTVFGTVHVGGPVTCLAVNGDSATIVILDEGIFGQVKIQVTDNQPDTFDALPDGGDCSVPLPPTGGGGPVSGGDIVVVDAPPLPTSKDQCKNGGWRSYGVFKNQGECVSFVATGGKNPPSGP